MAVLLARVRFNCGGRSARTSLWKQWGRYSFLCSQRPLSLSELRLDLQAEDCQQLLDTQTEG